jgi:hypothetical protein
VRQCCVCLRVWWGLNSKCDHQRGATCSAVLPKLLCFQSQPEIYSCYVKCTPPWTVFRIIEVEPNPSVALNCTLLSLSLFPWGSAPEGALCLLFTTMSASNKCKQIGDGLSQKSAGSGMCSQHGAGFSLLPSSFFTAL